MVTYSHVRSVEGMEAYIKKCYEETIAIVKERRSLLDRLTQELLKRETITKDEIEALFESDNESRRLECE